jgi:aminoglycoside phosphotransferase (APT) family kinase protein
MHINEAAVNKRLVAKLLSEQYPQFSDLPLRKVEPAGSDNVMFRLGHDLVLRFPRIPAASRQLDKEIEWLPRLAPLLPLEVPVPIERGEPSQGYPFSWSIYRWIKGETASTAAVLDNCLAAKDLACFVKSLQQIDTAGGPAAGPPNSSRGIPLNMRDSETRKAIAALEGRISQDAAEEVWDSALQAAPWTAEPVWIHGDLLPSNLLVREGSICAVIDFGSLSLGDPACDVMAAWTYLTKDSRDIFRKELDVDDETWLRGRGWALSFGLIALPYYHRTNLELSAIAKRSIEEAILDYQDCAGAATLGG